jgi:predicted nucleic acid-binding protein
VNVVDSCGWIEFLRGGPNAAFFEEALLDEETLVVPAAVVYEVFKCMLQAFGEDEALSVLPALRRGRSAEFTEALGLAAADISVEHGLSHADAVILATAHSHDATLWTQDADLDGLPGVRYTAAR